MNDTTEDLIDRISMQDYANAQPMFAELMATKLHDALDAEKIKVASQMFDPDEDTDEDLEDEEFDEEDLDEEDEE